MEGAEVKIFYKKRTLNLRAKIMDLSSPKIMGILNLTPDSFFPGSRIQDGDQLISIVHEMVQDGVHIVDIGGYSSRPGAEYISVQEESDRILPSLEILRKKFPELPVSVDTFRAKVAEEAIENGADMINDISAGDLDPEMQNVICRRQIPYVCMHMKGDPKTMTGKAQYEDLMLEIIDSLQKKVYSLNSKGVNDILIDPGFGFSKNIEQNFWLLKNLKELDILERPVLVGISRKSMIYKSLKVDVGQSLSGTIAAQVLALNNNADILRVHDVKEASQSIKIFELYRNATPV
jgi:dihydropteroate synthase